MKKKREYYTVTMTFDASEYAALLKAAEQWTAETQIPVKPTTLAKSAYIIGLAKMLAVRAAR